MKNTKILIDGNVLGMAIQNRLARTGVYFVIENKIRDNLKNKSSIEFAKKFTWKKATDKILQFINKEDAYS